MRSTRESLTDAAMVVHTTRATVIRYARSALRRTPSGRYAVTKSDRLLFRPTDVDALARRRDKARSSEARR